MEFQALWDGPVEIDLTGLPAGGYFTYSANGLVGTGSDTLTFLGRQDPGCDRLDDVIVTDIGAASGSPEPATFTRATPSLLRT